MVRCSQKGGEAVPGILEAAERFMVRWHEGEAQLNRQRRAPAVGGVQGSGGRGGNSRSGRKPDRGNAGRGGNRRSRRETAEDESRKEMAERVARHQADWEVTCLCYSRRQLVQLIRTWSSLVFFFVPLILCGFH